MNESQLIKNMQKLARRTGIELKEFVLAAGAAELLYGVVDQCGDIDVTVSQDIWNELIREYDVLHYHTKERDIPYIEFTSLNVDVHVDAGDGFSKGVEVKEGVYCLDVKDLIRFRHYVGRPKDLERIKLIEKKLS